MKARIASLLLAGLAMTTLAPRTPSAQPASAIGKPLPDGSMSAGTVSVRVIAGSPASPVIGVEVTLLVNGAPQLARTDASGRANFTGLPAGANVQAKIKDAEGKDVTSDGFGVPASGGARVMLSTKPMGGGGGGAGPMSGGGMGGQGMPEPRKLSGQARQDRETDPGTYVVRLSYNDLAAKPGTPEGPPAGVPVFLVGYASDDTVIVKTEKSDAMGRVAFPKLDMTGNVGYFSLANLPRGAGVDRLYAMPTQLDGQAGYRTILSGEKRDSTAANIDQYQTAQAIPTDPGKVRVTLEGLAQPGIPVRLVDATTGKVIAQQASGSLTGDPSTVTGGSTFTAKPEIAANTLAVYVHGGLGGEDAALGDVEIRVIAADAQGLDGVGAVKSAADGKLEIKIPDAIAAKPVRVVFKILGRDFVSDVIDATKSGGTLDIKAHWAAGGRPHALFDLPYQANQVLYAEAVVTGKLEGTYRSLPFLTAPDKGVHLAVIIYPRVMVKFQMRAMIEDQLLAVSGKWTVDNNSWIPYRASADGMMIPAPKGFKGGVIADMNQNDVAVVPGEGFRILRPLPPGSNRPFVAGFSLAVDGGNTDWALDLPLGTVGSEIAIRQSPGMKVQLPEGVAGKPEEMSDGSTYFRIADIRIPKGRSMAMTITGLPSPPGWKIWAPRVVGVLVVLMIVGGVVLALARTSQKTPDSVNLARKNALLEELVELERSGADNRRREQLIAELEKLWSA
jgi:hypothetical protein